MTTEKQDKPTKKSNKVARLIFDDYWQNVPVVFADVTIDRVDSIIKSDIISSVNSMSTDKPKGLIMTGGFGTGKSSVLYLIKKMIAWKLALGYPRLEIYGDGGDDELAEHLIRGHWMRNNLHISIISHFELTRYIRDIAGDMLSKQDCVLYDKKVILMIDDLGRGYDDKAGWNLALQDEYFDWRWQHRLPTFITTNKTPQELRQWDGWGRIVDRIADPEWMKAIRVGGESKRKRVE